MDKIDKKLYDYYKNIEIPRQFYNIPKTINKSNKKTIRSNFIWKISTTCALLLIMISTVAFGKEIYQSFLQAIRKNNQGLDTAIKNNYYTEIHTGYVNSEKIGIKLNNILMDDYNLIMGITLKLKVDFSIKKIYFKDMIIIDENNNLIFCNDKTTYEKFCKDNGIESSKITEHNLTNKGYGIEIIEKNEEEVKLLYKLYSDKYPKSKTLNVTIKSIEIKGVNNEIEEKNGNWKMKIDLSKQIYERGYVLYFAKDGSDIVNNIKIENVIVTDTQTVIEYSGKYHGTQKEYENNEEGLIKKIDDYINNNNSFYDEIRLENENGKIFNTSATNDSYGTYYSSIDGSYKGKLPFSLTRYDLTDKIYLIIKKNGKEEKINLER